MTPDLTPDLAIVVSPRDWAEHLHRFVADHGGARVRARVLDSREALAERYHVLVAEDLTSFLTPRLVAEVQRLGRRVLGVFDPTEPWGRERLEELGVDAVVPATREPEAMLEAVKTLAASLTLDADLHRISGERPAGPADAARPWVRAPIVAVGGPPGGPGATETAIALTVVAAQGGSDVALVDADDAAPGVAQRLGLPLHPNLRTAMDRVQHRTGDLDGALARFSGAGVRVLAGVPSTRDWLDVRPGEAVDVLIELARVHDLVVTNVGHCLEELVGASAGHGRFGLTREVVRSADAVVAVAAPSPLGLARLLDWAAEVRALTDVPLHVAFNRAPAAAFQRGELAEELHRGLTPASLTFLPHDRRVEQAAWRGHLVDTGPFHRAVSGLARNLATEPAAVPA